MRFILRAIVFGLLAGTALFFFPFHFFLFPLLLAMLIFRLFFRPWRWHRYGYGPGRRHSFAGFPSIDGYGAPDENYTLPIDGYGYSRRPRSNREGRQIIIH